MQLLHAHIEDIECLIYSLNDEDMQFPEEVSTKPCKLTDYPDLPIYQYEQIQALSLKKVRTPDKILSEEGISTYNDLKNAYFLLRNRQLRKSARVRKLTEEKYSNISNFF